MRLLPLGLVLLAGCSLYPFDGDDDVCEQWDIAALSQAPAERKVNPQTLTCEEFYYGYPCNTECGPCPGAAQYIPPWGHCESACSGLGESACEDTANCRATRKYQEYYLEQPSFEGCYEVTNLGYSDQFPAPCEILDAEQCAARAECTGLYVMNGAAPLHAPRGDFRGCIDEGQIAGTCDGQVACRSLPPTCPANTTPGVANGCWTGSCIPDSLCGVASGG